MGLTTISPIARLRQYGGRLITIDGRVVVEMRDPNDNAHRRCQYRREADGIERRVLTADGQPYRDSGSPWEPVDIDALRHVRGTYHPILDPLGL